MPRWLPRVLRRIRRLAAGRRVVFTLKALREIPAVGLGLDVEDAVEVVGGLSPSDFARRLISDRTGEWMYTFRPRVLDTFLYVKVILRGDCIVVSFHQDREDRHGNQDE